jgi:hypothetical protein
MNYPYKILLLFVNCVTPVVEFIIVFYYISNSEKEEVLTVFYWFVV